MTLSPLTQWVGPGSPASFTMSVTNTDTTCLAATFHLNATGPSGWSAALGSTSLTLNPGETGSTGLTLTSPLDAAAAFYPVAVTATNGADASYTGAAEATVAIVAALTLDLSVQTSPEAVTLTAMVRVQGIPAAGVNVSLIIWKPRGSSHTKATVTTDAGGTARYTLPFKKNDPAGTYQVEASTEVNGLAGSATTSFTWP